MPRFTVMERFLSKITVSKNCSYNGTPCWEWNIKSRFPYGTIGVNYKSISSHRFIFEYYYGEIKQGLEIDHLCKNKKCCNPLHLQQVTHEVNVSRAYTKIISK